ncbi:MAG: acetolactate synthase small subunit [Oscillospiraceae bacterium]|jgi:acetolactate synthase-1/3 small subunit|nr:acetolactate synthase small subunit [Oscillospiraceae bacterium]
MNDSNKPKHVIVAKVDNIPGVVSRISGFFTRRGYNIESFVTSVTENPAIYHLTFSVLCSDDEAKLLAHQMGRIAEVIEVCETEGRDVTIREFMLIKINCPGEKSFEILQSCEMMKVKIVGRGENFVTVEVMGNSQKLDDVIIAFERYGIIEIVRSGAVCVLN